MKVSAALAALTLAPILSAGPTPEERAVEALPPYRPEGQVSGVIRLWGHGSPKIDFMGPLVRRWEAGFMSRQPGIAFDYRMYGTASAVGALYGGAGDLAIMGQPIYYYERDAYERVMGYPPVEGVEIATGSLDVRNCGFAQMFFVNKDNPIDRLTLAQIDAMLGTEHRRGEPRNFRVWGDLGLGGAWAQRPIDLYGWSFDNDFWLWLRSPLFGGSHRLNAGIREYAHIYRPDGTIDDAGQQILEALAGDRYGFAISNIRYLNPRVKALAIAERDGGPFVGASKETLISREYPLTWYIPAVYNQAPGRPVEPKVREFLRYLLSRDGQEEIVRDGKYLPENPETVKRELEKIEGLREFPNAGARPAAGIGTTRPAVRAALGEPPPAPGLIRIWGDPSLGAVVGRWEEGFRRRNPGARFETRLMGTGTGIAGLYSGAADVAFLGREISPVETMAYAWEFKYKPAAVDVLTGSLDAAGKSHALAMLVHRDNPVSKITLAQLDGIFGCEHRRGGANLRTWGQLGLAGDWANRPITAYGYDTDLGTAQFFRNLVLKGSGKWNWEALREFNTVARPDGSVRDADARIADALSRDPGGIGISSPRCAGTALKALPVAVDAGGPFFEPTHENVAERRYPLSRAVIAFFNRPPNRAADPTVAAFLGYVLSPEGQDAARPGGFLPVPRDVADAEAGALRP